MLEYLIILDHRIRFTSTILENYGTVCYVIDASKIKHNYADKLFHEIDMKTK